MKIRSPNPEASGRNSKGYRIHLGALFLYEIFFSALMINIPRAIMVKFNYTSKCE
jgi:hypothetical protein